MLYGRPQFCIIQVAYSKAMLQSILTGTGFAFGCPGAAVTTAGVRPMRAVRAGCNFRANLAVLDKQVTIPTILPRRRSFLVVPRIDD
jgi:hypothetical protein